MSWTARRTWLHAYSSVSKSKALQKLKAIRASRTPLLRRLLYGNLRKAWYPGAGDTTRDSSLDSYAVGAGEASPSVLCSSSSLGRVWGALVRLIERLARRTTPAPAFTRVTAWEIMFSSFQQSLYEHKNEKKRSPPAAARGTFVGGRTVAPEQDWGDDRNKRCKEPRRGSGRDRVLRPRGASGEADEVCRATCTFCTPRERRTQADR
mmetsp:Transcript_38184/g.91769  ORF Transcript_38184/g.91769 Transcript_38184/m.91769 type:complete len:207 (-) Transcript_38184:31-651(-)